MVVKIYRVRVDSSEANRGYTKPVVYKIKASSKWDAFRKWCVQNDEDPTFAEDEGDGEYRIDGFGIIEVLS